MKGKPAGRRLALAGAAVLIVIALSGCFPAISIEGTWSGVVTDTYLCESYPYSIELTFTEDTVAVTGGTITQGPITPGASGTYEAQDDGRFTLTINDGGTISGVLIVDAEAGHAAIVIDSGVPVDPYHGGLVGVVQSGALQTMNVTEDKITGDWTGIGVTVDAAYQATDAVESTATFEMLDGLQLTGTFGTADFSTGQGDVWLSAAEFGYWSSSAELVAFTPGTNYAAAFSLSYDEQWLAAAFLTDGCDLSLLDNLPAQKFALYRRE